MQSRNMRSAMQAGKIIWFMNDTVQPARETEEEKNEIFFARDLLGNAFSRSEKGGLPSTGAERTLKYVRHGCAGEPPFAALETGFPKRSVTSFIYRYSP
jgi:hypothetical protein